jgi:hypothetical protein
MTNGMLKGLQHSFILLKQYVEILPFAFETKEYVIVLAETAIDFSGGKYSYSDQKIL